MDNIASENIPDQQTSFNINIIFSITFKKAKKLIQIGHGQQQTTLESGIQTTPYILVNGLSLLQCTSVK